MTNGNVTTPSENDNVRHDSGSTIRTVMYVLLLGFAFITFLAACGTADDKESANLHGSETWEETSSVTTLPGFLNDHTQLTKDLYSEVHNHADLMSGIPCYCGCMVGTEIDEAHDSLLRCYWGELPGDDGSVTWTNHSTNCGICKMEMEDVIALSKEGKTADEILAAVNAKYQPK